MDFFRKDKKAGETGSRHGTEKDRTGALKKTGQEAHGGRPNSFLERNSREEALGYINEARRTDEDSAARQIDIVQREQMTMDEMIDNLSAERAEELFWVRFDKKGVDASVSETGVGSLYFGNGRFRLTHGHGPEISLKEHIRRFAVQGDREKLKKEIRACKGKGENESIERLRRRQGYVMNEVTGDDYPPGALMELYFEDGKLANSHPSRGRLESYEIRPTEETEHAEDQRSLAMEIGKVVAASQRFGEHIKAAMKKRQEDGEEMTKDVITDIIRGVIQPIKESTKKDMPRELEVLTSPGNVQAAISEAKRAAERKTEEEYIATFNQRIQGYFANQLFLMSGIADRMGIEVDKTDQPKMSPVDLPLEPSPEGPGEVSTREPEKESPEGPGEPSPKEPEKESPEEPREPILKAAE